MADSSILDIKEKYIEGDAIKSYEFTEYLPTSGSNLNIPGTITIHIESQDEFYHPRRSCLLVEGDLLKEDGGRWDGENIALANNGIMHLFSNVKYELVGSEMESVNDPGIAGVMMGIAKNTYEYALGVGMKSCWAPETSDTVFAERGFLRRKEYIITKSVPKGSFSFEIEMEDIFGFNEDYDKVTYGMRHKLTLVRKGDDDAIFKANGVDVKGKVVLSKIAFLMPRVQPSDIKKFDLYKMIESKVIVDAGYRMRQCHTAEIPQNAQSFDWRLGVRSVTEKPRHILIGFQTERAGDQKKNPSLFDHVQATQISVILNDTKYPSRDVIADFPKHKYVEYYKMFTDFTRNYYHMDPLTVGNFVDIITYKEEYPIFYINVEHQSERLSQGVVDIMIRMRFGANIPKGTVAYALVISDRRIKFQSDGKKMNILY